ncbi:MAG: CAP domain-containing protein [Bdellovibrionota bacterium]
MGTPQQQTPELPNREPTLAAGAQESPKLVLAPPPQVAAVSFSSDRGDYQRSFTRTEDRLACIREGHINWMFPPGSTGSVKSDGSFSVKDPSGTTYTGSTSGQLLIRSSDGKVEGLQYSSSLAVFNATRAADGRIASFSTFSANGSETRMYQRAGDGSDSWTVRDAYGRPVGAGTWKGDVRLSEEGFSVRDLRADADGSWKTYVAPTAKVTSVQTEPAAQTVTNRATIIPSAVPGVTVAPVSERSPYAAIFAEAREKGIQLTLTELRPGQHALFRVEQTGPDGTKRDAGTYSLPRGSDAEYFRDRDWKLACVLADTMKTARPQYVADAPLVMPPALAAQQPGTASAPAAGTSQQSGFDPNGLGYYSQVHGVDIGDFLVRLNNVRAQAGLRPVSFDPNLAAKCRNNNIEQSNRQSVGHFWHDYSCGQCAAFGSSNQHVIDQWLGSYHDMNGVIGGHRAMLLHPDSTVIGIDRVGGYWTFANYPALQGQQVQYGQTVYGGQRGYTQTPQQYGGGQRGGFLRRLFGR